MWSKKGAVFIILNTQLVINVNYELTSLKVQV